jgi:hypothetical protein
MKWIWQKWKMVLCFFGIIFLFFAFLGLRTWYFTKTVERVKNKLESQYQLKLTLGESSFIGLNQLSISDILVKSTPGDTVFLIDSLNVQLKILELLKRKIRFNKIYVHHLEATIKESEVETVLQSTKTAPVSVLTGKTQNYAHILGNVSKTVFSFFPNEVFIDSSQINYRGVKGEFAVQCPTFSLKNHQIDGHLQFIGSTNFPSECIFQGQLNDEKKAISFSLLPYHAMTVSIPIFEQIWGLGIRFDSLHVGFNVISSTTDLFKCSGYINTSRLNLNHPKLAPKPVVINEGSIHFNASIGKQSIEIDSTSIITCNRISFSPYISFRNTTHKELALRIIEKDYESETLFQSFPEGLFTNIRDIKTKGTLGYSLNFMVNLDNPDSILLSSALAKNDFRIEQFGAANLNQLNDTFTYEVFENNQYVRSIFVGPENPNYTPLNEIPSCLQNSVLTSEDGGFFYHKGFDEASIKNSISDNLKKGRFARGGSTITMQLVKNVFLNKNKTVSRKLEELLMVWMIENLNLTTKERMFEVYLNIIEWGPGIYGIKEASDFYFQKKPSQLNLNESIFLASIIPSPDNFRFTFNKEGNLRDYYEEYYCFASETMLSRGWITPEDTVGLIPNVVLKGAAKNYLAKNDSLVMDSLPISNLMPAR